MLEIYATAMILKMIFGALVVVFALSFVGIATLHHKRKMKKDLKSVDKKRKS